MDMLQQHWDFIPSFLVLPIFLETCCKTSSDSCMKVNWSAFELYRSLRPCPSLGSNKPNLWICRHLLRWGGDVWGVREWQGMVFSNKVIFLSPAAAPHQMLSQPGLDAHPLTPYPTPPTPIVILNSTVS